MSSWSDSKPPNVRLVSRATTSSRSPSWTTSAMSGRPKAIPSSTSRSRRSGQLAVAAGRGADAGHGQAQDGDERVGVARAARREPGELAVQRVVDVERRERQVDRERHAAGRAAPRLGGEGQEALAELVPALGRRSRTRPRRRGRRSG